MKVSYRDEFFRLHLEASLESARQIIPVVRTFYDPKDIVDIGCGIGTWLKAWMENNVSNVLGVDGSYVKQDQLLVDSNQFVSHDLSTPLELNRKFGLVTSMEVGEHITPARAETFVASLCACGDLILFSAAIPGQGGTFHFNEQYPEYWAGLFAKQGYVPVDCVRKKIWDNQKISWWYRQNVLFFVKKDKLSEYPLLKAEFDSSSGKILSLVHPELLKLRVQEVDYYKGNLHNPVKMVKYYVKKIIKR